MERSRPLARLCDTDLMVVPVIIPLKMHFPELLPTAPHVLSFHLRVPEKAPRVTISTAAWGGSAKTYSCCTMVGVFHDSFSTIRMIQFESYSCYTMVGVFYDGICNATSYSQHPLKLFCMFLLLVYVSLRPFLVVLPPDAHILSIPLSSRLTFTS